MAAVRDSRVPHHRRGLGGARGLGERAAGHHGPEPLLRAHDVQGHEDARHQGHHAGPRDHRGAGEGPLGDAGGDGGPAREAAARRDRRPPQARELDRALPRAGQAVRRARAEAARDHRQGPARPDLHEQRRRGDERGHLGRPHRLLRAHPEQPDRAVGVAGVGSPAQPRLPRVLQRARRRLRGAPDAHRVDAAGQVRRGVQRGVLGGEPLRLAGGGLALGHPQLHEGAGGRVLRDLLRPEQPDRRAGGRLQGGRRQARPRAVLRAHPARARPIRRRS